MKIANLDKPFDIITVGDSTVDTFIKIHNAAIECDMNQKNCKICLDYGGKIPVESIAHGVAGNAANVAVGCATLGLKTSIYTNLGNDWQGKMIKNSFDANGVNCDYVIEDTKKSSNLSVVLTYQGERTIFVYHQNWFYKLPRLKSTKWIYLTSLSESFTNSNIVDEVAHYVDKTGAKLAFAPGTYQLKANIKRYPKTLERCELILCNLDECKQILEIGEMETVHIRKLLDKMLLLGPRIIVVTDGEEGSYATDGKQYLKLGVFPSRLTEKTGAGDSYACAFMAALIANLPLAEAMVWGTINASHVIRETGAQNGLLGKSELERYRKSVPEMVATAI